MIYHELFPTFFLLSKTLNVSAPPHIIGTVGNRPTTETEEILEATPEPAESTPEPAESTPEPAESTPEPVENSDLTQPTV